MSQNKTLGFFFDERVTLSHLCHKEDQDTNVYAAQYKNHIVQQYLNQFSNTSEHPTTSSCHIKRVQPKICSEEDLLLVHTSQHLAHLRSTSYPIPKVQTAAGEEVDDFETFFKKYPMTESCKYQRLSSHGDLDTLGCQHSYMTSRVSIGSLIEMLRMVLHGEIDSGIHLSGGGHHGFPDRSAGLCLFNDEAIAVKRVMNEYPNLAQKVCILDWDVHHGDGTEQVFYTNNNVLTVSMHRYDGGLYYPASGAPNAIGELAGEGYNVNICFGKERKGSSGRGRGNADYMKAFETVVKPIMKQFNPDIVLVFSGFDCVQGDPIGNMNVTHPTFGHILSQIQKEITTKIVVTSNHCYSTSTCQMAFVECMKVLLGEEPSPFPTNDQELSTETLRDILETIKSQAAYWPHALQSPKSQIEIDIVQRTLQQAKAGSATSVSKLKQSLGEVLQRYDVEHKLLTASSSKVSISFYRNLFKDVKESVNAKTKLDHTIVIQLSERYIPNENLLPKWIHFLFTTKCQVSCDDFTSFVMMNNDIASDFSNYSEDDAWPVLLDEFVKTCFKQL